MKEGEKPITGPVALQGYRILDLTEGGLNLAGKLLGDLGADVIRVEPPGGGATRRCPPFYNNEPGPERSLFFFAFNVNKRGITLDITHSEGQRLLKELVKRSAAILESFPPGYLDSLGLGYAHLSRLHPPIVVTSITPFGQAGPYAHFKATDIVSWATGGMLYMTGDEDRPPVRVSFPFSEVIAGAQGAAGTMHGLWHRDNTGEGQHVDVSMQEAVLWIAFLEHPLPLIAGDFGRREGVYRVFEVVKWRTVLPCKDGYVNLYIAGGPFGARSMAALGQWMEEEGMAPPDWKGRKWEEWSPSDLYRRGAAAAAQEVEDVTRAIEKFLATKGKRELFQRAIRDRILLAPCNDAAELLEDEQLRGRRYWVEVEHPELAARITYPGPFVKMSETPIELHRRPPQIGEHNQEVYGELLGLSKAELARLQAQQVV